MGQVFYSCSFDFAVYMTVIFKKYGISLLSKSLNYLSDFTMESRKIKKNYAKMSFILLNFPFLQNMYVCTYVLKLQKQISLQSILTIDTV